MRERTHLDTGLKAIHDMERDLIDSIELIELGEMEDDTDVVADAEATIEVLHGKAQQAELQTLLSGEADNLVDHFPGLVLRAQSTLLKGNQRETTKT